MSTDQPDNTIRDSSLTSAEALVVILAALYLPQSLILIRNIDWGISGLNFVLFLLGLPMFAPFVFLRLTMELAWSETVRVVLPFLTTMALIGGQFFLHKKFPRIFIGALFLAVIWSFFSLWLLDGLLKM